MDKKAMSQVRYLIKRKVLKSKECVFEKILSIKKDKLIRIKTILIDRIIYTLYLSLKTYSKSQR